MTALLAALLALLSHLAPEPQRFVSEPSHGAHSEALMTTSWYGGGGDRYAGKTTASGARLDPARLTCAHRTLPFGTRLRLTVAGHSTVVTVNDRGPWARDRKGRLTRDLDVTAAAADALGMREYGVAIVSVEII